MGRQRHRKWQASGPSIILTTSRNPDMTQSQVLNIYRAYQNAQASLGKPKVWEKSEPYLFLSPSWAHTPVEGDDVKFSLTLLYSHTYMKLCIKMWVTREKNEKNLLLHISSEPLTPFAFKEKTILFIAFTMMWNLINLLWREIINL